jgi:hypothetical protein
MFVLGVISGFRRKVAENRTLLGYYVASSGNFLPTFRYIPSVPSFKGQESRRPLKMGPTVNMEVASCHETVVTFYKWIWQSGPIRPP